MDLIILRFPGLAQLILKKLDDQSLANSKNVSRSITLFLNREAFFWKRIIQKYTNNIDDFKDSWKAVTNKTSIRGLASAVKYFLSLHPSHCTDKENDELCKHRNISYSPLQISAEAGNFLLSQFILRQIDIKNPPANGDELWTPLHEAAKNGYLEICKLIMNNVYVKNPCTIKG